MISLALRRARELLLFCYAPYTAQGDTAAPVLFIELACLVSYSR